MNTAMNLQTGRERNPRSLGSIAGRVAFAVPPFVVAFVGSQWTSPNVDSDCYRELAKPSWQPPSWVFAPVWSVLYLSMAVAAWRVWLTKQQEGGQAVPLSLWAAQLALNLGWTYAFFERRSPLSGVFVIVTLWLAIVATMLAFAPKARLTALLLSPYLAPGELRDCTQRLDLADELKP
jgi:tryptophan-rich sensory protein